MQTRNIYHARVLRVDRTPHDRNGNRGARVYVQAGVAGPLYALTISGRACPPDIERWAGRLFPRLVYSPRKGEHAGALVVSAEWDTWQRIPDLSGTDNGGAAWVAGALIADLLRLRKDSAGRYSTSYGTKTAAGLARTVATIINEEAGK